MEVVPCIAATAALIAILTGLARGAGRSTRRRDKDLN
jgi:hypothetical protein